MRETTTQILAKEGWKQLGILALVTLFFLALEWDVLAFLSLIGLGIAAMSYYNPERIASEKGKNLLLAPLDGVVKKIEKKGDSCVVTINSPLCMVGVVRLPLEGEIVSVAQQEGLRVMSLSERAKEALNARGEVVIKTAWGEMAMRFFPSFFAENLYLYPKAGAPVAQGVRIGFLKHGMAELILPASVSLKISEGDKVRGGETLLGGFPL